MFLRVSPTKGIMRFGMVGKLSIRYIKSYPVLRRVGEVAYRLELPPELPKLHNIFHVSRLWSYIPDPSYVVESDPMQLQEDLSYEEQSVRSCDGEKNNFVRKQCLSEGPLCQPQDVESNLGTRTGNVRQIPSLVPMTRCI